MYAGLVHYTKRCFSIRTTVGRLVHKELSLLINNNYSIILVSAGGCGHGFALPTLWVAGIASRLALTFVLRWILLGSRAHPYTKSGGFSATYLNTLCSY